MCASSDQSYHEGSREDGAQGEGSDEGRAMSAADRHESSLSVYDN